jgi:hypothetical protein
MRETGHIHCGDVGGDRKLGEVWESNFCELIPSGCIFIRHQKDRDGSSVYGEVGNQGIVTWRPSPDVTVWHGKSVTSHHEIKHKNAHAGLLFGLEKYRMDGLMDFQKKTGQTVYYTIHDHDCSGGRNGTENDIKHWVTQTIESLASEHDRGWPCRTYRNGVAFEEMTLFWHRSRFEPLEDVMDNISHFAN